MAKDNQTSSEEWEIRQKIHELNKKDNDITRKYGSILKTQLATEGKITDVLKARVNLAEQLDSIMEEDIQNSEKSRKINEQIKIIEKKQLELKKKYIGKNKHIADDLNTQLNTDKALLEVQRDRYASMKDLSDLQKEQSVVFMGFLDKITSKVKKLPGGRMLLAALGLSDKNMQKIGKNFNKYLTGEIKSFKDVFKVGGKNMMGTLGRIAVGFIGVGIAIKIATGLFKLFYKIGKMFAAVQDELAGKFGVMGVQSNTVTQNLISQRMEVTKIGYGLKELNTVTSDLSDNFGIGLDVASGIAGKVLDTAE